VNLQLKIATVALAGAAAFIFTPKASGDPWDKKTIVTFPEAVEFPGRVVVPPGQYVMKLLDSQSNRHIVQVFNDRQSKIYATVLAIPTQRSEPPSKTVLTFYEIPKGQPMIVRKWYYPGDTVGQEFVYPKDRAMYIAQVSKTSVPTTDEKGRVAAARVEPPAPSKNPESAALSEGADENGQLTQSASFAEPSTAINQQTDYTATATDDEGVPADQAQPQPEAVAQAADNDNAQFDEPDQQADRPADQAVSTPQTEPVRSTRPSSLPATAGSTPYLVLFGSMLTASGMIVRGLRLRRRSQ